MKTKRLEILVLVNLLFFIVVCSVFAQDKKSKSRFSHKGLKAFIGVGDFEATSDRGLNEGEGGSLGLGYGFTDRFSLWITALGVEHPRKTANHLLTDFAGLELNLQHKFETQSRLQPYGKIGVGVYGLQDQGSDTVFAGFGLTIAIGTDLFFSQHFGIGAELIFKSLDYSYRTTDDGDNFTKIQPQLDGDTVGFMLTFTVQ